MCRAAVRCDGGVRRPVRDDDPRRVRIGDAERDAAAAELGEHFAVGRLDRDEFSSRLDAALAARTAGELDRVFVDLPRERRRSAGRRARGQGAPLVVAPVLLLVTVALVLASVAAIHAGVPPLFLVALVWLWRGHRRVWR